MPDLPPKVKRIKSFRSKQFRAVRDLLSFLETEQVEAQDDDDLDRLIQDVKDAKKTIGKRLSKAKRVIKKAKNATEQEEVEAFKDRGIERGEHAARRSHVEDV